MNRKNVSLVFSLGFLFVSMAPGITFDFNDYDLGNLSGQQGWTISNADGIGAYQIVDDAPGFLYQALELSASNRWAENTLPSGTNSFSFDFVILQGPNTDPDELFFRYGGDGWDSFIAFKPQAGTFEIRSNGEFFQPDGSGINPAMPASFQYGNVHNISAAFSGNQVVVEFDGAPYLTATFTNPVQLPEGAFDLRSANTTSYIGNAIPEPGTALLSVLGVFFLIRFVRSRKEK